MKKISLIILTVFLNLGIFSCSPETIKENIRPQQTEEPGCCGDDIPPDPPGDGG